MPRLIDEVNAIRKQMHDEKIGNEETRRIAVAGAKRELREKLPGAVKRGESYFHVLDLDEGGYEGGNRRASGEERDGLKSLAYRELWDWIENEGLIPGISSMSGYVQREGKRETETTYYIDARIPSSK